MLVTLTLRATANAWAKEGGGYLTRRDSWKQPIYVLVERDTAPYDTVTCYGCWVTIDVATDEAFGRFGEPWGGFTRTSPELLRAAEKLALRAAAEAFRAHDAEQHARLTQEVDNAGTQGQ